MIRPTSVFLFASLLTLSACDETDAVAVRITIRDDMSGTVQTSGLVLPAEEGTIQKDSQGVTWGSRIDIASATGTFAAFGSLQIADIGFSAGETEGIGFARVTLPRGEAARWPKTFVPLTPEERKDAASALDPSGKSQAVGATIKIELELPSAVVGNGLTGKTRGMKATSEGATATLVVPLDTAAKESEPVVWHLTWQR
jgi:hypothetical protein